VARRADGDHLVYQTVHRRADGEPVRSIVDAVTGDVLEVDAGIAHAVGRVYPTDPRGPLEIRELPGLLPGTPLRAPGFSINDELYPPALPSGPGEYLYFPGDPAFDQVNTFWHVAHDLGDFFRPLGYAGPPESLIVRIHFALEPEVARTNGNFVTFGRAIAGFSREPSLADDIVIYGFGIQPGGPRREASALHEGLADYFAAAFTGDPAIGEWAYLVFPNGATRLDMPSPPWDLAHYDQVGFAGGGAATAWGNGMILSSGLWDLRQRIGSASDSLVLEALDYLPTVPTWGQFVNAVFLADQDHHDSRFWTVIGEVLGRRGITGTVTAQISVPAAPPPNEPIEIRALPCCGGTVGHYHWRARMWLNGGPAEAWRDVGDDDVLRTSFSYDTELELSVVSPFGGRATSHRLVLVRTPVIRLEGPTRVTKNMTGTWHARVIAASPWRVVFRRQWLIPGAPDLRVDDQPTSVTFPVEASFTLTAVVTDTLNRPVETKLQVEAVGDRPPPSSSQPVRLAQLMDGALAAETHVELGEATSVRVAVYDIRGRQRVLLDDGGASQGERVIRWDARVLEPGVYFVRAATSSGHSAVLRFVVLR
jgi:hypothetical protein